MGCVCRNLLPVEPQDDQEEEEPAELETIPVVEAVSDWLAARWLPAPRWRPDPEWHDTDWPAPPMEPASMAVLTALVLARKACQRAFQIDPAQPDQLARLTRIVGTLNRRTEALQAMDAADRHPWAQLAAWNTQIDTVQKAAAEEIFQEPETEEKLAPWRPVLGRVKALTPLVAIARLQEIDFKQPEAVDALARVVKTLRRITLPPLVDPAVVLRLISRANAVAQLQDSFGADPRRHSFERVAAVVQRKAETVADTLPKRITLRDGKLDGMPTRQPNPGQILNRETIAAARRLTPDVLDRLRWQVPNYQDLPLLTSAAPVAALTQALTRLGANPVRQTPCGNTCDAASAMRDSAPGPASGAAGTTQQATATPGSGTGARPAG